MEGEGRGEDRREREGRKAVSSVDMYMYKMAVGFLHTHMQSCVPPPLPGGLCLRFLHVPQPRTEGNHQSRQ